MASPDENIAIVKRVTHLIEVEHDIDALDEVLAEDFVNHSPSPGYAPDREGFKATARAVYGAFSDLESFSDDVFAVDDKVVERWHEIGVHTGTYYGVEGTGRRVTVRGLEIWRLRDGRIVERWAEVNEVDIFQQIGLLPDLAERAAR